jgi:hypothetical protein
MRSGPPFLNPATVTLDVDADALPTNLDAIHAEALHP